MRILLTFLTLSDNKILLVNSLELCYTESYLRAIVIVIPKEGSTHGFL